MKSIANLLANIEALVLEKNLVTYLLNGLNPKFDNISLISCHKDTHVTFLKARSTLVSEEFHINRMHTSSSSHFDHGPPPTHQVVLANSKPYSRRPNHNSASTTWSTGDNPHHLRSQPPSSSPHVTTGARYPPAHLWSSFYYPWTAYG